MADHRAASSAAQATTQAIPRTQATRRSSGADGDSVCAQDRDRVGRFAPGNGLRQCHDLLETSRGLAESRCLGQHPSRAGRATVRCREPRFVAGGGRFDCNTRCSRGEQLGLPTTNRSRAESRHDVATDGEGIPVVAKVVAANAHDVTQLISLVDCFRPAFF
jgi:hypothetical protein